MRKLTHRQRIGAVLLVAVALLFISLDFAGGSLSGSRAGASGVLGSLYRGTDGVLGPVRRFVQGIPDVGRNRARIAQLEQQNIALRKQVADEAADATTAAQLRTLQLAATSQGWTVMPARVTATGTSAGFEWTVTVDVGAREKVAVGQTVTDGAALVGRVLQVGPTSSVLLLAVDPQFGVGARDARSGDLFLADGASTGGLSLSPLADAADIRAGDQVVTGPAGASTFVPGLTIGTVTSVHRAADGSVRAAVRPAADQTGLNLVGIVQTSARPAARPPMGG